jgi:hypothetical protein
MPVSTYQTIWCYIPDNTLLHACIQYILSLSTIFKLNTDHVCNVLCAWNPANILASCGCWLPESTWLCVHISFVLSPLPFSPCLASQSHCRVGFCLVNFDQYFGLACGCKFYFGFGQLFPLQYLAFVMSIMVNSLTLFCCSCWVWGLFAPSCGHCIGLWGFLFLDNIDYCSCYLLNYNIYVLLN